MTSDCATDLAAPDDGFAVRDAASANWVIRKIVEARAYAQRVKAWAELEQRRAQREEDFLLRRFGVELQAWARQEIARQHDGRRSVSLPAGAVGFRTEPTRLAVTDGFWFEYECERAGIHLLIVGDDIPEGRYSPLIKVAKYEAAREQAFSKQS